MWAIAERDYKWGGGVSLNKKCIAKEIIIKKGIMYPILKHGKNRHDYSYFLNIDGTIMQASKSSRALFFKIIIPSVLPQVWYKLRNLCMQ